MKFKVATTTQNLIDDQGCYTVEPAMSSHAFETEKLAL